MDGPWGHEAKWNRSDRKGQIPYDLIDFWAPTNQTNKSKLRTTENNKLVVVRGGVGTRGSEIAEGSQKVQTSSYD